jgi:hypothetical protein
MLQNFQDLLQQKFRNTRDAPTSEVQKAAKLYYLCYKIKVEE